MQWDTDWFLTGKTQLIGPLKTEKLSHRPEAMKNLGSTWCFFSLKDLCVYLTKEQIDVSSVPLIEKLYHLLGALPLWDRDHHFVLHLYSIRYNGALVYGGSQGLPQCRTNNNNILHLYC